MIEESYQREMQEKDIDTTEPVRRRRTKKEGTVQTLMSSGDGFVWL